MTPDQLRAARQIAKITAVMAHINAVARQVAPLVDATVDGVRSSSRGNTGGPEAVRNVLSV